MQSIMGRACARELLCNDVFRYSTKVQYDKLCPLLSVTPTVPPVLLRFRSSGMTSSVSHSPSLQPGHLLFSTFRSAKPTRRLS